MSLQSDFELTQDPKFRGKVLIALSKAAKKVIEDNSNEEHVRVARDVLARISFFSEAVIIAVAAEHGVDSSSPDEEIYLATMKSAFQMLG
jgi:hypothetical protein